MAETQTITTQIVSDNARTLIEFIETVFDGSAIGIYEHGGVIVHSQIEIGNSHLFVASSNEEFGAFPAMLNVYVPDVDEAHARALENGATNLRDPEDQFYGDRTGGVLDTSANQWWIATRIEDVSEEEMRRRMAEMAD